jgi:beta-lactam-binding protein with PASTA domain
MRFLLSPRLWLNLFFMAAVVVLIVVGSLWWLKQYTRHGESVEVPTIMGMPLHQLDAVLAGTSLRYEVTDSIYSDDYPRGAVVLQNPPAGMRVKEGRTIFITVNSTMPEMVPMPDLVGKSRRIALPVLEITGLQLAAAEYVPDESCTDCIVEQLYRGKPIAPGQKVRKGERIVLRIGQQSKELVLMPMLLGLTYTKAVETAMNYRLNPGTVLKCDGCYSASDSAMARVMRQLPDYGTRVPLGTYVDFYLTTDTLLPGTFVLPVDTISPYDLD